MTTNMADRTKAAKSAIYPNLACTSTARRQIAAADRARLHALGPRTGGDGAAARRPLQLPQPQPLPTDEAACCCSSSSAVAMSDAEGAPAAQRVRDGADACGGGSGR